MSLLRYTDIHSHDLRHTSSEMCRISNCRPTAALCTGLHYSLGAHPWYAEDFLPASLEALHAHIQHHPKGLCAIGECGLDKLCTTPFETQIEGFRLQIQLAERYHYPLIIHLVKAWDELLSLRKELKPQMPWIIHGFRGKPTQAEQLLRSGLLLSFSKHYHPESLRLAQAYDALFLESDDHEEFDFPAFTHSVAQELGIEVEELMLCLSRRAKAHIPHLYAQV